MPREAIWVQDENLGVGVDDLRIGVGDLTAADTSAAKATVAPRILGQILLVIILSIIKSWRWHNLRRDRPKAKMSQLLLHRDSRSISSL